MADFDLFLDDNIFEDNSLELSQRKRKYGKGFTITEEEAQRASQMLYANPSLNGSLLVGLTKLGLSADDPRVAEIATKNAIQQEKSNNKLKQSLFEKAKAMGKRTVQALDLLIDSGWEATTPKLARALEYKQQTGASFSDAWSKASEGTAQLTPVLKAEMNGQAYDIGKGFFLDTTKPEDTDEFKELIDKGIDPVIAREYVMNNVLGEQIYANAKKAQTQNIQFVGERAKKFEEAGLEPIVTPGRFLFKPLDDIFEPGTRMYNTMTGFLDAAAQLFLDPATYLTAGGAKIYQAGKTFKVASEVMQNQGLLKNGIRQVFAKDADKWLQGADGTNFKKVLWQVGDNPDALLSNTKTPLNADIMQEIRLAKRKNPQMSFEDGGADIMSNIINKENILRVANDPGLIPQVRKNTNFADIRNRFAQLYGTEIDVKDKEGALRNIHNFLLNAGVKADSRKTMINDFMDALYAKDSGLETKRVVSNFLENVYRPALKEAGVTGDLLDDATGYLSKKAKESFEDVEIIKEMNLGQYGIDSTGNTMRMSDRALLNASDEVLEKNPDFQQINQALFESQQNFNVYLPDPKRVIKASKILEKKMGANYKNILDPQSQKITNFFDWYYTTIFKPLALLKPAWTTKVIGEEQLRIIARGLANPITHPIRLIARAFYKGDKSFDPTLDVKMMAGLWEADEKFAKALSQRIGFAAGAKRKFSSPTRWGTTVRGNPEYAPNLTRNVYQAINDRIAVEIASIDAGVSTLTLDKLVNQMYRKNGKYRKYLEDLVGDPSHPYHKALTNKKVAEEFLYTQRANLHQILGGQVIDKGASAINWVKTSAAKQNLEMVANKGKFKFKDVDYDMIDGPLKNAIAKTNSRKAKNLEEVLRQKKENLITDKEYNRLVSEIVGVQDEITKGLIGFMGKTAPNIIRGEFVDSPGAKKGISALYDKTTDALFTTLMGARTDNLSRAPAFKRLYWKKVSDSVQYVDASLKPQIVANARKALKDDVVYDPKLRSWLKKIENSNFMTGEGTIADLDIFDNMIKAWSLDETKKLLYDISTRTRAGENVRFLFPFFNAYTEILTTWGRLSKENALRPVVRLGQFVESAREQNPIFDPNGSRGFFYKNPINGEEVFGYPGSGIVSDWMFGDLKQEGVDVQFPAYVSSVNLVASIIPGVGPVLRVPAAYLVKGLPEEGIVNQFIFGDFGVKVEGGFAGLLEQIVGVPAFLKKFYTAFVKGGAENQRLFANTQIDVYKAMVMAGLVNDSTKEGAEAGMEMAKEYARKIFVYRGLSQFVGPTGAASPTYSFTEDKKGVYFFQTLAQEYRNIKQSTGGDDYEATRIFIDRFGLDPTALVTTKSQTIKKRPMTIDGAEWRRQNPELYDKFDLTAYYLEPLDDGEFSYDSYWKALQDGDIKPRSIDEWVRAKNRLLGALAYENFIRENNLVNNNSAYAQKLKRNKKIELENTYFGYGLKLAGSAVKPELEETIDELYTWIDRGTYQPIDMVKDFDAAIAFGIYAKERDWVIGESIKAGATAESFKNSKKLLALRSHLRNVANSLIIEYPDFEPLYRSILEVELKDELSDTLLGVRS